MKSLFVTLLLAPLAASAGELVCAQRPSLDEAFRAVIAGNLWSARLEVETLSGRSKLADLMCRHSSDFEVALFCSDRTYELEISKNGKAARLTKLESGVRRPVAQLSCGE